MRWGLCVSSPGQFADLGRLVGSPFFTADVARLATGGFTIIELNDGGCSTWPEQLDPRDGTASWCVDAPARRARRIVLADFADASVP